MPREDPVVHWEHTILCYGTLLKFGVATAGAFCFCFRATGPSSNPDPDRGPTDSPSSNPLVDAPLFVRDVLDVLPKRSLPYHGWRNENVAPNERRRADFDSGASTTASSDLEGVHAVRFCIPKWNGFDMALETFRSFRYNFLGEQGGERGLVFAPS